MIPEIAAGERERTENGMKIMHGAIEEDGLQGKDGLPYTSRHERTKRRK